MKTTVISLALCLAFTGCSTSEDPAPAAGNMSIRLTNSPFLLGASTSARLADTPLRASQAGNVLWSTSKISTTTVPMGSMSSAARGKRLYLSIQYDYINRPGFLWPSGGGYIQADVLVDGKMVNSVMLNAESFNDSANCFLADSNHINLVREVAVGL